MSAPGSILVGCFGDVAWIRVEGSGSHLNSDRVRDFAKRLIDEDRNHFVVDLQNCPGMDSTFMGTLTAIAQEMKRRGHPGAVEILNANERNRQSLIKLGLQHLLRIDDSGSAWQQERELVAQNVTRPLPSSDLDRQERLEMVLEAHEALIKANSENRSRFQDVLEYLHRDLESNSA
ncbi:MAG: STAS domain-containing protein [Verrucomicrobiae bacterium]|nr:STAS domain-containing protein [Verrucomicrobiae bacterium]MCB1086382.1 STAS domain-containing protein [Verrucomicrobiae bacterium]MCB1091330.1 STAS domain-containing protein [Verrucomicrobiae bacterium]